MAKVVRPVVGSKTTKLASSYGVIGSKTKKLLKGYAVVGGVTKPFYASETEVIFTSSTTWTVPSGVTSMDVFCVGGGGGTGGYYDYYLNSDRSDRELFTYPGSGAGGYTKTVLGIAVTPGETLTITVGSKGSMGYDQMYEHYYGETTQDGTCSNGTNGGTSSVKRGSTVLASADGGGYGNKAVVGKVISSSLRPSDICTNGSNGGTGGTPGGGEGYRDDYTSSGNYNGGSRIDVYPQGSTPQVTNGANSFYLSGWYEVWNGDGDTTSTNTYSNLATPGKGQGTTTRAWGIDSAEYTLYSTTLYAVTDGSYPFPSGNTGGCNCPGIVIIRYR